MVLMEMHALVSTDNTTVLMYMCGLGGGGRGERGRPPGTWVVDCLSVSVHVHVCVCVCLSVVSA